MILYREGWFVFDTDTFDRTIIQVYVRHLNGISMCFDRFLVYTKTMVLRSDFAATADQVFNRVVQASVTVVHFESFDTISQGQ
ncbi:hypothetical protein D3C72_1177520 [compost metagenome]